MSEPQVRPITIAIAAMGGQGGGVLSDWIVDLAEANGYLAQSTSVPGVAQRTGATVYYLEIFAHAAAQAAGRDPVMALMPVPGDVDVVVAGELVEAGRAIIRGFVTPERTVLVASRHRDYALSEKMAMGDGRVNEAAILEAAGRSAREFVCFDMAALAEDSGSVISSVLFGALAGTAVLPFTRAQFEQAIRASGVAVSANLAGFAAGYARAGQARQPQGTGAAATPPPQRLRAAHPQVDALLQRLYDCFPAPAHETLVAGVRRLIDYQDVRHAGEYLNRLEPILLADRRAGGSGHEHLLLSETARHLALWMSYEDTIRVADLKTRRRRFERVRKEVGAGDEQLVYLTEFMHPRVEEICDTLPAALGALVMGSAPLRRILGLFCRQGRKIRTATLSGFVLLYALAGLRRFRRSTYRYRLEEGRITAWLGRIREVAGEDYELAVEVARCQRLVKGYGDTYARGLKHFETVLDALARIRGRAGAAAMLAALCEAALADEHGGGLEQALRQVA